MPPEMPEDVTLAAHEIQTAWQRVQEAHAAYAQADNAHIDGAIYRLIAAQAEYDALVGEHFGVTPEKRKKMLRDMQESGLKPEIFATM